VQFFLSTAMYPLRNIDISNLRLPCSMTWAPLTTESAFLLFSVLSGTGAAAILLRDILRSKRQKTPYGDLPGQSRSQSGDRRQFSSLLDRITLLNRNLIQCSRCFTIEHAHARFCTRCGASMQSHENTPTYHAHNVEARYLAQDGASRVYGLSMNLDPQTRIGVLIGIQNRELPQSINRTRN
jgi:hypothetical protein